MTKCLDERQKRRTATLRLRTALSSKVLVDDDEMELD